MTVDVMDRMAGIAARRELRPLCPFSPRCKTPTNLTGKPEGTLTVTESENEQAYRDEAARLKALPAADRDAVIALHRAVAANPKVPKADRQEARKRADALARLLRRPGRKPKKKQ